MPNYKVSSIPPKQTAIVLGKSAATGRLVLKPVASHKRVISEAKIAQAVDRVIAART